ncbi:hypothetical protein J4476_01425 [Candidatus Woesearchaeota archaeon]|nr:MAG: hypothetical protein QT09_C0012G0077 [archaeon GW2011_AR18]MBS3161338.1 hypothetical protein [Candidatus Woesearchaeota archaeon]HIH25369.1 hypothetical protein [Nanoarchaeota archaeon]
MTLQSIAERLHRTYRSIIPQTIEEEADVINRYGDCPHLRTDSGIDLKFVETSRRFRREIYISDRVRVGYRISKTYGDTTYTTMYIKKI